MKFKRISSMLLGLTNTIKRFTFTATFLLATVIYNGYIINSDYDDNYYKLLMTFLIGAAVTAVLQLFYERFGKITVHRLILMAIGLGITILYYFLVLNSNLADQEITVRTFAFFFLLLFAFLWIPVIKSRFTFNDSFMALFKASMIALFYSLILFVGIALIIGATDLLIIDVDYKSYTHTANIVFLLYAPLHFLTLIPRYRDDSAEDQVSSGKTLAVDAPKFLENLISYVIIPITAVFTIILLLYILLNITGDFWTNNLLEQMLVTYSITVIMVYLLSSKLDNAFANAFRGIFPKVLVPIVLFQTVSSCLMIGDLGITYSRYYVILFGIFAVISGLIFSFLPVQKNGLIAPILIFLTLISILWPVDAFTISRMNQAGRLKAILEENDMLSGNEIVANANLSESDQTTLINSLEYLEKLNYLDRYPWLNTYRSTSSFKRIFGFDKYPLNDKYENRYFSLATEEMVAIHGYDYMKEISIYGEEDRSLSTFESNGSTFSVELVRDGNRFLVLKEGNSELVRLPFQEITNRLEISDQFSKEMTLEEASFTVENDTAILTLVAKSINISIWQDQPEVHIEGYLLIKIR